MAVDAQGQVKIPKQVQANADMAEQYIKSLNGNGGETDTEEKPSGDNGGDEAAGDDTKKGAVEEGDGNGKDQVADNVDTTDDFQARYATLEQQYKTLQGKYNAEVPRLTSTVQELQSKITDTVLKQFALQKPEPVVEKPAGPSKLDEFLEKHGDADYVSDLLALVKEQTGMDLAERVKPLEEKVSSVEKTAEQQRTEAFEQKKTEFFGKVQQTMGAADTSFVSLLNGEDEKFNAFLQQSDPSGLTTYGEALVGAAERWDEKRMAAVLNTFFGKTAAPAPKAEVKTDTPKAKKVPGDDTTIAPSRSAPAATAEADDPIIWTPKSLKQFEKDCRAGKVPADKQVALWDDVQRSVKEGRFRDD